LNLRTAVFDQSYDGATNGEVVAMTALMKKTGSRISRWLTQCLEKNRSPYRWYENDVGLG